MPGIEDKILDQMTKENIGFNEYSLADDYAKAMMAAPIYKMFLDQYLGRDISKYGRLSFEDYVGGLTPEESFIGSLGSETPSKEAILWNEQFGEDTDLMKAAAFDYGKTFHPMTYPDAKNTYKQGE